MKKYPILLIRHAQSLANASGDQIGYTPETDYLTDFGRLQAEDLWKRLAKILERHNLIDVPTHIHASDTLRARFTRDYMLGHSTIRLDEWNVPDARLREIDPGKITWDLTKREIIHNLLNGDPDFAFPNGESRKKVYERMQSYMQGVANNVLHIVFSHGIAISSFIQGEKNDWNYAIRPHNLDIVFFDPVTKDMQLIPYKK